MNARRRTSSTYPANVSTYRLPFLQSHRHTGTPQRIMRIEARKEDAAQSLSLPVDWPPSKRYPPSYNIYLLTLLNNAEHPAAAAITGRVNVPWVRVVAFKFAMLHWLIAAAYCWTVARAGAFFKHRQSVIDDSWARWAKLGIEQQRESEWRSDNIICGSGDDACNLISRAQKSLSWLAAVVGGRCVQTCANSRTLSADCGLSWRAIGRHDPPTFLAKEREEKEPLHKPKLYLALDVYNIIIESPWVYWHVSAGALWASACLLSNGQFETVVDTNTICPLTRRTGEMKQL